MYWYKAWESLLEVIAFFKENRVKYVITGAIAVGYYAEPRATEDVDFVVQVGKDFEGILNKFPYPVYSNGNKYIVDVKPLYFELWMALSDHDKISIKRGLRRKILIGNEEVLVNLISPEDLIISKLIRYSHKDRIDIVSLLESVDVDMKYVRSWAILNRMVMRRWESSLRELSR